MPSRPKLLARLSGSYRYEEAGEEFGIPPGLAYMIVTGLPADGSDVLTPEEIAGREGVLEGPTQALVNPPELPKHKPSVEKWMKSRAGADAAMTGAGEERTATPPPTRRAGLGRAAVAGMDRARDAVTGRQVPTP